MFSWGPNGSNLLVMEEHYRGHMRKQKIPQKRQPQPPFFYSLKRGCRLVQTGDKIRHRINFSIAHILGNAAHNHSVTIVSTITGAEIF